ncbi:MAG: RNA 2',3'-cyclic phosphodiesterase [Verrucomicrobiia bacterium]
MADDSSTDKLRLFIAIPVPEPVRDEIIRVQREMQPLAPHGAARWTRPDQFHLTLRFLGDVPVAGLEQLKESVNAVCRSARSLQLRAGGIGFFPNPHSPRVVWVGIDDQAGLLDDLQKRIETAVRPFTAEPGEKHFSGHVTLGRLKNLKPPDTRKLAAHAQTVKDRMFGEWMAHEIEIIRSELSPGGARHTTLAAFRLGAV